MSFVVGQKEPNLQNAVRDGFAKLMMSGEARAPDRKIGGSAGRACLDFVLGGFPPRGAPLTDA
jgi:hypothetical protein